MSRWPRSVWRRVIAIATTLGVPAGLAVAGVSVHRTSLLAAAVIAGLVAIPVILRIIRGSVAISEMRFLAKVQIRQSYRSRRLRNAFREGKLKLDPGEKVVVEIRRHPATMVSPVLIISVIGASVKGLGMVLKFIGAVLKFAVSSWQGLLVTAAVVGASVYFIENNPTVVYVTLAIVLAIVVIITTAVLTMWIRYWMLQTYVFTTKHLIIFPSRKKPPVKFPLPNRPEAVVVFEPGTAKSAARFRLAMVPWANVVLYRVAWKGGKEYSVKVAELTGVPGAKVLEFEGLFIGKFPPPLEVKQ